MPHNGHIGQINLTFHTYWSKEFTYINLMKLAGGPFNSNPALFDQYGFPVSSAANGVQRQIWVPSQAKRPGNWVIRWNGTASVGLGSYSWSVVSGSLSAGSHRAVVVPNTSQEDGASFADISFNNIDNGDLPSVLEVIHEDDEEAYDNGEIFNPTLSERVGKFGVIRSLVPRTLGMEACCKWEHEIDVNSITYGSGRTIPGLYKGTTTNDGDAFSVATEGFVLSDKATVAVQWNTTRTGPDITFNAGETGAYPLKSTDPGVLYNAHAPSENGYATLIFDADLEKWLRISSVPRVGGGMPLPILLRLCKEVRAHPHICIPVLAIDPLTNWLTEAATFCRNFQQTQAPWMRPIWETGNEIWNFDVDARGTRYVWAKAKVRWGADFDEDNWYGRAASLIGAELASVYAGSGVGYEFHCAVWTSQPTSRAATRLAGKHETVDGGTPAGEYFTHLTHTIYFGNGLTAQQELDHGLALQALETDEEKQAYADDLVALLNPADLVGASVEKWADFAGANDLILASYEGGPHYHNPGNVSATITGASKAAQCVLTLASSAVFPTEGMVLNVSAVGGMTELNGGPYDVVSVDRDNRLVTIDVDSTEFTTYESGGTATYADSGDTRFNLRRFMRHSSLMEGLLQLVHSQYHLYGGVFPSSFDTVGGTFGFCDPTIYDPLPVYEGAAAFSTGAKPLKLNLTGS